MHHGMKKTISAFFITFILCLVPQVSFAAGGGFTWFSFIPGLSEYPYHLVGSVFVAVLLIITTWIARVQLFRAMQTTDGALVPHSKLTYRNFFELFAESIYKLTQNVIGEKDAPIYFPLIGTLFIYILTSNFLGLIPGSLPPTDNLNTTLALGGFVFLFYNGVGIKTHGFGYIKHFMGPVWWLAPLIGIIELFSHVFRPISLGLRLRGNIMGDHLVLSVFSDLAPYIVPVIFYGLGVFVCLVQAFVFCLLTMVYISLSSSHDH